MTSDPYRLPTSVVPERYRLRLAPDLDAERFDGTVTITAQVTEPSATITLNADGLTVSAATVRAGDGEPAAATWAVDADAKRLTVTPAQPLEPGPVELTLAFAGAFDTHLVGLYASRFTDDDGVERKLATTQFEATYARKCFPCWDEPAFKAVFELELDIDPALDAVANSLEVSRQPTPEGRLRIAFAPTIPMSTYLVAFVVGPLAITDPVDVDGTPLRIVHVPGKGELTGFALEAGAFALRYFADYFGLPYPGDKLDLVAIPDFAFGAMENLGCVTFREVLLLIDPKAATHTELQRAADVINHEIAHMWFGDLVTMSWWNGLWLNEAFATFMEMRCTDAFRPEWERWVDFGLARTEAFETDALGATRPIEFEVVSPSDAEGMFDVLTYEKGAAVVRMLEQYLGEDRFRAGINRYMRENQFGNAETTDLWDAIEAETGEPVRRIMDSWIFQGGFPAVSVDSHPDRPEVLTLAQERALKSDELLALMFITILSGYPPEETAADFALPPRQVEAALVRLERLALINRLPGGRVRSLVDRTIIWRKSPMRSLFEERMKAQFMAIDYASTDAVYTSEIAKLSPKGAAMLAELIEAFRRDVQALARQDRQESHLPRRWFATLAVTRTLDDSGIERLRV